ncbi:MAG: GGDEF domain-containing protein [Acetatifactor sp.]|nr:GGDEF domain-containing protein [Acetatifactor sp.]
MIRWANFNVCKKMTVWAAIVFVVLLALSLLVNPSACRISIYSSMAVLYILFAVLFNGVLDSNAKSSGMAVELMAVTTLSFGLLATVFFEANSGSIIFPMILIISAVTVVDVPWRMVSLIILYDMIYSVVTVVFKEGFLEYKDIVNGIIFTAIATGIHIYSSAIRFRDMSRSHIVGLQLEEELANSKKERTSSQRHISVLASLAEDFMNIMYADLDTNRVIDYYDDSLTFYSKDRLLRANISEHINVFVNNMVYLPDQEYIREQLTRENILKELDLKSAFAVKFRMETNDGYSYYELKIVKDRNMPDTNRIIAAIHNVDSEMKKDMEYRAQLLEAVDMANSDALTGVRNKNAYLVMEEKLMKQSLSGKDTKYAIVMCDVNSLKETNDNLGHSAGDVLIRNVSGVISSVYKHSPVYRIGGDEFIVVLTGADYEHRDELLDELRSLTKAPGADMSFAAGMAVFDPETDGSVNSVFKRADQEMYKNKRAMKSAITLKQA